MVYFRIQILSFITVFIYFVLNFIKWFFNSFPLDLSILQTIVLLLLFIIIFFICLKLKSRYHDQTVLSDTLTNLIVEEPITKY